MKPFLLWLGFLSSLGWAGRNQADLQALYFRLDAAAPEVKESLTKLERHDLFLSLSRQFTACLDSLCHYDPQDQIGFSFGRAIAGHLLARELGLKPEAIAKVLVIGELKTQVYGTLRYHMATAVKGENGYWYVIDPVMVPPLSVGSSVPLDRWIAGIRKNWDPKHKANFYLLSRHVMAPDLRRIPASDAEAGVLAIERAFQPYRIPGFRRKTINRQSYFLVDGATEEKYFTKAEETRPEDEFSFVEIEINRQRLPLNDYFDDLFSAVEQDLKLERFPGIERPRLPKVGESFNR